MKILPPIPDHVPSVACEGLPRPLPPFEVFKVDYIEWWTTPEGTRPGALECLYVAYGMAHAYWLLTNDMAERDKAAVELRRIDRLRGAA